MSNPTFWLDWNSDFRLTPAGSIQTAVGWDAYRQRCVRRIITSPARTLPDGATTPPGDVFNPKFGEGLADLVDQPFDADSLASVERSISNGILQDPDTNTSVPPSIIFQQPTPSQLNIFINAATISGQSGTIALSGS